jgi:hypothetical protein
MRGADASGHRSVIGAANGRQARPDVADVRASIRPLWAPHFAHKDKTPQLRGLGRSLRTSFLRQPESIKSGVTVKKRDVKGGDEMTSREVRSLPDSDVSISRRWGLALARQSSGCPNRYVPRPALPQRANESAHAASRGPWRGSAAHWEHSAKEG